MTGEQNTEKHSSFVLSTIKRKLRELFENSDLKGELWKNFSKCINDQVSKNCVKYLTSL